jgi:pyruvate dehydrogenase E2 component (dihydrolipoamide acetyltransferase)
LSVLDLFVKASALAMKQVPDVNAAWMDSFVRRYDQVDVNLVMGTGSGLLTPVVKDVGALGLKAISKEIAAFEDALFTDGEGSDAALDTSKLTIGTFSIHNLGMFGVKSAAPIVLPPQACALALGAVVDTVVPRAAAKAGEDNWEVAPVMVATLSCDHRVVDGAVGAQWLSALKTVVENPSSILL